jgi:O-antigen ligase/tetratricopeptide (TPR) repeat protein
VRPRDRAALVAVAAALAFATLAIGGAPRWAAGVASLLGLAAAAPYLTSRRTTSTPSPLLLPLAVAGGLTALQLVPLPAAIAEQLAPARLDLARDNAAAWGDPMPGWVVASYDPPATLVELAKLVGYLALAYAGVRLAANRRARTWLAAAVAGTAAAAAVVTLGHHALGADRVYGVYAPSTPHLTLIGPLVNVNHLASLLAIAVPVALGLAMAARGLARAGWLAVVLVLAGTLLLSASRGGALGLAAGVVVAVAILVVQRRAGTEGSGRHLRLSVAVPAGIVAACTVVLLAVVSAGDLARDLEATTLDELHEPHSKYQVWGRATDLATDNRWLGVGRGGFEPAFTPHSATGAVTYSHAENGYLQAVVDWGLPGAALLALTLVTVARIGLGRWRHGPLEAGAIGGLAALAVHDLADFSIELPAVAMAAIATAAVLFPDRLGTATEPSGARARAAPRRQVTARAALIAAGAAVVGAALTPLGRDARGDAARVAAIAAPADRLDAARAAQRRHPADYLLAGHAAEALYARGDARAIRVVARGIARHPNHAGLHHLAARILTRTQRPDQAAVEFAAAARWAEDVEPIVADVLAVFDTPEAVARALPTEPRQAWRIVAALGDREDARLAYTGRIAFLHPRDPEVQAMYARAALDAGSAASALDPARAAWTLAPTALHAALFGRVLAATGDLSSAIDHLTAAVDRTQAFPAGERLAVYFALADAHLAAGAPEGAKAILERAVTVAGSQSSLRVMVHLRMANVEERLGNRNQAEWERQQARALEPP